MSSAPKDPTSNMNKKENSSEADASTFKTSEFHDLGRSRRGRPSGQRRVVKHIEKKGQQLQAARRAEILESFGFPGMSELEHCLEQQHEDGADCSKQIFATTRGLGFHIAKLYEDIRQHLPVTQSLPCNVNEAYRVTLQQLDRKLLLQPSKAYDVSVEPMYPPKAAKVVEKRNGRLVAQAINQCGTFEHEGATHQVEIPEMRKERRKLVTEVMETGSPTYRPESPVPGPSEIPKRKRSVVTYHTVDVPDPYHVTIRNLRKTVELMSSELTPRASREFFIRKNPIPGAMYDENLILVNANEVMPNRYFETGMNAIDIGKFTRFLNLVNAHRPDLIGETTIDNGKGSPSILCTQTHPVEEIFRVEGTEWAGNPPMYNRSPKLPNHMRLMGELTLMGEAPIFPNDKGVFPSWIPERHPKTSCHTRNCRWTSDVLNLVPH